MIIENYVRKQFSIKMEFINFFCVDNLTVIAPLMPEYTLQKTLLSTMQSTRMQFYHNKFFKNSI